MSSLRVLLAFSVVTAIASAQTTTTACNTPVTATTTPTTTRLFGWGVNSKGQLGYESSLSQVAYPQLIQTSSGVKTGTVWPGMFHTFLKDISADTLWTTGEGSDGQLGLGETQLGTVKSFSRVEQIVDSSLPKNLGSRTVRHANGGWKHSCAIYSTESNASKFEVFCTGDNSNGQIGNPSVTDSISLFIAVQSDDTTFAAQSFKEVRCGADFTVALDEAGNVWSWGANDNGQLGYESTGETKARQVVGVSNVQTLNCGSYFCVVLTNSGSVLGWGRQDAGQLAGGSAPAEKFTTTPKMIVTSGATRVRAGGRHVLAMIDGKLNVWGAGTWGQTGLASPLASGVKAEWYKFTPTPIPFFSNVNIQSFDAGFKHSIVLDTCGRIFTFGSNAFGQLGIGYGGTDFRSFYPREVATIKKYRLTILEVRATAYNSFAITS